MSEALAVVVSEMKAAAAKAVLSRQKLREHFARQSFDASLRRKIVVGDTMVTLQYSLDELSGNKWSEHLSLSHPDHSTPRAELVELLRGAFFGDAPDVQVIGGVLSPLIVHILRCVPVPDTL